MSDPAPVPAEYPAPDLLDRLVAGVAVGVLLTAILSGLAVWRLDFLGRHLGAPLTLFLYQLPWLCGFTVLYSLVKTPLGAPDMVHPPVVRAVSEVVKITVFATLLGTVAWQMFVTPPSTRVADRILVLVPAVLGWAALGFTLVHGAGRHAQTRRSALQTASLLSVAVLGIAFGCGAIARLGGVPAEESPGEAAQAASQVPPASDLAPTAPTRLKVLVLGIDGADLDEMRPLIEAGRIPHIARLVREGTCMPIEAKQYPEGSAVLWTNIATGVSSEEHGLSSPMALRAPGLPALYQHAQPREPVTNPFVVQLAVLMGLRTVAEAGPPPSNHRRVDAVWNLVSKAGGSVRVLGFPTSWPAEAVRGELLTDRARRTAMEVFYPFRADLPGASYPPDLLERLTQAVPGHSEPPLAQVEGLADWTPEELISLREWRPSLFLKDPACWISMEMTGDEWGGRVLEHSLRNMEPRDLTLCHFNAIDQSAHMFWDASHPDEYEDVPEERQRRYGDVTNRAWEFVDRWVGRILPLLDERTVLLLASDHGMRAETYLNFIAFHAPDALLIAWRPGIVAKRGLVEDQGTLLDLTPTMLWLLGFPRPEGLKGQPLKILLEPSARTTVDEGQGG